MCLMLSCGKSKPQNANSDKAPKTEIASTKVKKKKKTLKPEEIERIYKRKIRRLKKSDDYTDEKLNELKKQRRKALIDSLGPKKYKQYLESKK